MNQLRVKNWTEFQHYKDRNPPWIKLHRALLDDYEFARLHDASKAHLLLIWLFASQHDGAVPDDTKFLQKKLGLDKEPDLQLLVSRGFLIPEQVASTSAEQDASAALRESYQASETYQASEAEGAARKNGALALPTWLPGEPWKAWLEVRQRIKAPNTYRALKLALGDLDRLRADGQDVGAVIDQSVKRGWRAFFPLKDNASSGGHDYSAVIANLTDGV